MKTKIALVLIATILSLHTDGQLRFAKSVVARRGGNPMISTYEFDEENMIAAVDEFIEQRRRA